jgi:putative sterol carrier protein
MAQPTGEFFEGLAERGHEPLLEKATGSIRFDLANGKKSQRWLVAIDKGDVAVSHKSTAPDCTLRSTEELFDDIVLGKENAMAAVLRGAVTVDGDPELLVLFQRLFPGPPAKAAGRRSANGGSGR